MHLSHVTLQRLFQAKIRRANLSIRVDEGAHRRPSRSVDRAMANERSQLCKRRLAHFAVFEFVDTHERFLARVCAHMRAKLGPGGCARTTLFAFVGPLSSVGSHVRIVLGFGRQAGNAIARDPGAEADDGLVPTMRFPDVGIEGGAIVKLGHATAGQETLESSVAGDVALGRSATLDLHDALSRNVLVAADHSTFHDVVQHLMTSFIPQ
jgi:hypothetical protein